MKITTVLGTRPEIIRLSKTIKMIDGIIGAGNHFIFWTGQNQDPLLSDVFFEEFGLRQPDIKLRPGQTFTSQIADMFPIFDQHLREFAPNKVLILGDTNSSLLAIVAARLAIPVYHIEAGNRTGGPRYAEEINRIIIDHVSDVHLCYNERSRANLLREGIPIHRTFVVGNPIHEMIDSSNPRYASSNPYILVTLHRQENVDSKPRLSMIAQGLRSLSGYELRLCLHPRTRDRMREFGVGFPGVDHGPVGWRKFISLLYNASCVITDSGTVEEEASYLGTPCIVARVAQERYREMEFGGIVMDMNFDDVSVRAAIETTTVISDRPMSKNASKSIVSILLGVNHTHSYGLP